MIILIITGLESGVQKTHEVETGKCMCMHTHVAGSE